MEPQTIFLKRPLKLNLKVEVILYIIISVVFVFAIYGSMAEKKYSNAGLQLIQFIFIVSFNYILRSPYFKFSARILVDENQIKIKKSIFKKPTIVSLKNVSEITLASYKFTLHFIDKENELISYNGFADESIELKKALREVAALKNIPIHY